MIGHNFKGDGDMKQWEGAIRSALLHAFLQAMDVANADQK